MCHFCLGQDFRQTRAQDDDEADEGTEGAQGGVERVGEAGKDSPVRIAPRITHRRTETFMSLPIIIKTM